MIKQFHLRTTIHTQMQDITHEISKIVEDSNVEEGICTVFIPHTTAGITINENADPDVVKDFKMELSKIVPLDDNYRHIEGNSAAHIKASMMGFSETIIVEGGKLLLGTWQGVYFCEYDGPRRRKVVVRVSE